MTTSAPPESEATVIVPLPNTTKEELGEQEAAVAPSSTGKDEGAAEQEKKEQEVVTGAEDFSSTDQVRAMVRESPLV